MRARPLLLCGLAVLLGFLAPNVMELWRHGIWDVHVYIWAGDVVRYGDVGLYEQPTGGQAPYLYPPAFAAAWAGMLTALGVEAAMWLWLLVVASSMWLAAFLVTRETSPWIVPGLLPVFAYLYAHGQVGALIVLLVLGALALLRRARPGWAGLTLAVAIHMKFYPVVLLPAMWLRGERKAVGWTVLWAAPLALLSFGWVGWGAVDLYGAFAQNLLAAEPVNMSLATVAPTAVMLGALILALVLSYRAETLDASARLALTATVLSSPFVHPYSFVNLLLIYPLLGARWAALGASGIGLAIALMIPLTVEYDWWWVTLGAWAAWGLAERVVAAPTRSATLHGRGVGPSSPCTDTPDRLLAASCDGVRLRVRVFVALQVLVPLALFLLRWLLHDGAGVEYPFSYQMYSTFPGP